MYHSQIILTIFQEKGLSHYKVSKETGISESLFSKWKTNPTSEISSIKLCKIADYLDCSVDYLLGRTENATSTNSNNTISGNHNIIGNHNSQTITADKLTAQEQQLLTYFRNLGEVEKAKILLYAAEISEN